MAVCDKKEVLIRYFPSAAAAAAAFRSPQLQNQTVSMSPFLGICSPTFPSSPISSHGLHITLGLLYSESLATS
ncbi:hypothetical protein E2C01_034202 [Portunus trituberculatus]|uniref:Uncharacterized protein n=1 Tax=Portunus trituberculatus TaxID=210409 RepID=A0A5B7F5Z6_PORTR|nr:hypothetical protein [Portunus trituberculatus]